MQPPLAQYMISNEAPEVRKEVLGLRWAPAVPASTGVPANAHVFSVG